MLANESMASVAALGLDASQRVASSQRDQGALDGLLNGCGEEDTGAQLAA